RKTTRRPTARAITFSQTPEKFQTGKCGTGKYKPSDRSLAFLAAQYCGEIVSHLLACIRLAFRHQHRARDLSGAGAWRPLLVPPRRIRQHAPGPVREARLRLAQR